MWVRDTVRWREKCSQWKEVGSKTFIYFSICCFSFYVVRRQITDDVTSPASATERQRRRFNDKSPRETPPSNPAQPGPGSRRSVLGGARPLAPGGRRRRITPSRGWKLRLDTGRSSWTPTGHRRPGLTVIDGRRDASKMPAGDPGCPPRSNTCCHVPWGSECALTPDRHGF